MSINKNFVVRHGFEVNTNLIIADSDKKKVGIGTTNPKYVLDVLGGIGATHITVSGVGTFPTLNSNQIYVDNSYLDNAFIDNVAIGTGIGTFSNIDVNEIYINDAFIDNVAIGTGIGTFSNIDVNRVNVERINAKSGVITSFVSTGATITTLNGTSLNYTGFSTLGIVTSNQAISKQLQITGIGSIHNLALSGFVNIGGTTGKPNQILISTGSGVAWSKLSKNSVLVIASPGQDTFLFDYEIGTVEVYINGVRLSSNEFTAIDGSTITLTDPCFGEEAVEIIATQALPIGVVEVPIGITLKENSTIVGTADSIRIIDFVGTGVSISPVGFNQAKVFIEGNNPPGKTVYVAMNGNDNNSGLTLNSAKRTIKSAVGITSSGDTVKVSPGTYIENNPIVIPENVSIEGAELRNCIVTPQNTGSDLFHVTNGVHLTDLSFQGQSSTDNAAVVAFKPLLGTASNRFFDAARMIRYNLDFIASEAVGYLTSTDYKSPAFTLNSGDYTSCKDDIKDIFRAVCHDITRGGNSKCVGAGLSYYSGSTLQHIVGVKTETIDTIRYAAGIARAVVNNSTWGGKLVGSPVSVTNAVYSNTVGIVTITANNHGLNLSDSFRMQGLTFSCPSGPALLQYPSGKYGYNFQVHKVLNANQFEVVVGKTNLPHTYVSGGTVQKCQNYQTQFTQIKDLSMQKDPDTGFNNGIDGCANVVSAIYSCVGVVTSIVNQGPSVVGSSFNLLYPGNAGIGTTNPNHIPSQGVGNVTKGPYVRNCTNFIPSSVGMRVDGFHAEPGDKDDMGITGMMSVDSYTQYNQGGIGVEVLNGAYAQLVSIFTICDDKAIVTKGGGQCDITNSNSSFGTYGLVSDGVASTTSKSTYRYTASVAENASEGDTTVVISGVGNERPYSGQAIYFGELYYEIESVTINNGGSGFTEPPSIVFLSDPSGPSAIKAEAIATIQNGKIDSIAMIGNGRNYRLSDNPDLVTVSGGGGSGVSISAVPKPIYYQVRSATEPVAGISTVTLAQTLNNNVGIGTTVFLFRQSLQIVSSHSFEYIGAGNKIENARPSKGGVTIRDNEVVKINGGEVVYTSTDQDGNFAIGEDVVIDQATGTIGGRAFERSLLNTVTPFIIALGAK